MRNAGAFRLLSAPRRRDRRCEWPSGSEAIRSVKRTRFHEVVEAVDDSRTTAGRIKETIFAKWVRQTLLARMKGTNIHVRNVSILLVTNICREEVHVKRFHVTAPGSCQHCLQSAIALAVAFEREDLLIDMLENRANKRIVQNDGTRKRRNQRGACTLP
jgi:hypothetical protein